MVMPIGTPFLKEKWRADWHHHAVDG